MNRTALLAPLAAVALGLTCAASPAAAAPGSEVRVTSAGANAVKGSYIVTLEDGADARGLARALQVSPRYVYTSALNGFAATLTDGQVRALQRNAAVAAIEEDQVATVDATQPITTSGLYGLDRIDQRNLPLSGGYTYNTGAGNVYAYVIDTGIATSHSQFGGRASNVYDALGGNGQDCQGHGTHVAGTIGASTYGVAKNVRLRGLRVLGCDGSGSTSGIISAVDWLRRNHTRPAVANMSLGGGYSSALNTAVTNLANAGVATAVAAGNENANACNVSPASASNVVTVAASDRNDTRASFSNYGSCVETYAPGVNITSTWLNGGSNTISGTSMASPHVAGVMALYKSANPSASSSAVNNWIVSGATTSVVRSNPSGTPNRLLFKSTL
ncbi:peptidase inhibitor I9 [Kineococcus xinjiangensis]|uniref:Peptidase inhibitor I9 n=1 Tax=Kineococcus xinjiangensis TaxID=512762 RepID=A0A2S6IHX5_9ACTN|nr:S8 family peptidase [Kineococcus xinjiangensis]PPK93798.1 peptidase inhibitor I9 [Kineococcus xinjiangensis]